MRPADVRIVVEAGLGYIRYKLERAPAALRPLLEPGPGRSQLTAEERRLALAAESGMRRLGIKCLARSVVIGRMLRRRGVAASVDVSVAAADPKQAHAEVSVGGRTLRPLPPNSISFR